MRVEGTLRRRTAGGRRDHRWARRTVRGSRALTNGVKYARRIALPLGIKGPAITIFECYFECVPPPEEADVLACLFQSAPTSGWRSYEGATRLIDLTQDPDPIFSTFTKGTRYEINRARERDGIKTNLLHASIGSPLEEFMDYYDRFAASKGVPAIRRDQVQALAAAGKIAMSTARGADESILAAHAYIITPFRARLTHSASLFRAEDDSAVRAQIGRANRFLHWNDLISFQAMGVESYDFGGWYEGSRNSALLQINAFKQEFGGLVVKEWNSFRPASPTGVAYLAVRDLMLRVRGNL